MDRVDELIERVPRRFATPLWAAATVLAVAGSALMLLAATFGTIAAAVWSAVAFLGAAAAWQVADRTSRR